MAEDNATRGTGAKKSITVTIGTVVIGSLMLIAGVSAAYDWISSKWAEKDGASVPPSDSAAIHRAEQIIQGNLVNPDSYQRRSASVVWNGSTRAGKPMFGVKVDYNVQNAFGGTIRKCEYIFYFRDGEKIMWEDKFGREPCDAVQYFDGNEAALVNQMTKVLVEQHY